VIFFVIAGLDPAIHLFKNSCEQRRKTDARIKSGHDG